MTPNEEQYKDQLKDALQQMYDKGYKKGRIDALKALSVSLKLVADIGILNEEEKKGYTIALETVNGALRVLVNLKEDADF